MVVFKQAAIHSLTMFCRPRMVQHTCAHTHTQSTAISFMVLKGWKVHSLARLACCLLGLLKSSRFIAAQLHSRLARCLLDLLPSAVYRPRSMLMVPATARFARRSWVKGFLLTFFYCKASGKLPPVGKRPSWNCAIRFACTAQTSTGVHDNKARQGAQRRIARAWNFKWQAARVEQVLRILCEPGILTCCLLARDCAP